MSQVTRLFTTAAVAVVLTVAAMLFVSRPASAQVGRTAVCTGSTQLASPPSNWESPAWMNAQLKAGRTQFTQIGAMICAW
jgi:hypothetical protein